MWRTCQRNLRQSVQFIFNRVNEQFDESDSTVSYLITHFDGVIYFLSAFRYFTFPPSWRVFFLRPCQLIVAVRVDEGSLQKRLFEVTGCREHGPGNRHSKGNARALYLEHHFTPMKIAHDNYFLCRRNCYPVYFRTGRRALISNKCTPNLPARW